MKTQIQELTKNGACQLIVDIRRTSSRRRPSTASIWRGSFVADGTLARFARRAAAPQETIAAASGDGSITLPAVLLVDAGTSAAAELFASALLGNKRADLIGEHTIRARRQSEAREAARRRRALALHRTLPHSGRRGAARKGLEPTVAVDEPDVEFGQTPPPGDPVLEKALEAARREARRVTPISAACYTDRSFNARFS